MKFDLKVALPVVVNKWRICVSCIKSVQEKYLDNEQFYTAAHGIRTYDLGGDLDLGDRLQKCKTFCENTLCEMITVKYVQSETGKDKRKWICSTYATKVPSAQLVKAPSEIHAATFYMPCHTITNEWPKPCGNDMVDATVRVGHPEMRVGHPQCSWLGNGLAYYNYPQVSVPPVSSQCQVREEARPRALRARAPQEVCPHREGGRGG